MSDDGNDTVTLAERVVSVLVAAGFPEYGPTKVMDVRAPAFVVTPGSGATVGISWLDASADARAGLLAQWENYLRADGLDVVNRGDHLYVVQAPSLAAARLAAIRERADAVRKAERLRTPDAPYTLSVARRNSARDVPALLAAVEALEADRERRALLHQTDVMADDNYGMIQVVVPPSVQGPLREWLARHRLNLYPIPVEDDLPTYGIGITPPDTLTGARATGDSDYRQERKP